jgi:hypothetical protein
MRLKWLPILLLALAPLGCASMGKLDPSLNLEISPLPVMRGKPALARVDASLDAVKVVGTVQVFGSPQLIFRKDEDKGVWYFYGVIPFSPWVKPGVYTVRVTVTPPKGEPSYAEMKVDLK